jgi:hypothetical protein
MQIRLGWLLAVSCVAVTASASPGPHVTVLDFEGPSRLADAAQHLVLATLAAAYDIIPAKRWEAARRSSGPPEWSLAAKAAGVDAVIEGWIDPEGSTHTMTVSVREASTGRQIDTIEVKISDQGVVSDEQTRKLSRELDETISWVDAAQPDAQPDPPTAGLPPTGEPMIDVLMTGGFFSHHQGAVIWDDGTAQLFGPSCTSSRAHDDD